MPLDAVTVLVCVDGSRLSYLALEVGAALRKHGRLVVLHVQEDEGADDDDEAGDLALLAADLRERCAVQLNVPAHCFAVVTVARRANSRSGNDDGSGAVVSFKAACLAWAASEKADVVVLGGYGTTGARIGTLGTHAAWAAHTLVKCTTVLANPYANPVPPRSQGGTDAPKPQLFLLVLRAERPLNVRAIRATMALMAPWHSLLLLVLLNEAQTRADQRGLPAQPPIDKIAEDLKQILVDARLVAGPPAKTSEAEGSSDGGQPAGTGAGGSGSVGRSSVRVEPFDPTKTPEQLVVRCADSERADFIAMDRTNNLHDGVTKACRATVLLLPT